jgi:hypothetical protein
MRSILAMLALGIAAGSLAQTSLHSTVSGYGKYDMDGRGERVISRVRLEMYNDGRFRLFFSNEDLSSVSGTYSSGTHSSYRLRLETAFDGRATGAGMLYMTNSRLESLELSGTTEGRRFSASFSQGSFGDGTSPGWGGSGSGGWGDQNIGSVRGSGTVNYKGKRTALNFMRGSFSGSSVRMEFRGDSSLTVEGQNEGGSRFRLTRINGKSASGYGTVNNVTNSRASVSISGSYDGAGVTISFSGQRDAGGGSSGGGSWDPSPGFGGDTFGPKTFVGRGTLQADRGRDDLDRATVAFYNDGKFRVNFAGEARPVFDGTWKKSGNTYRLNVDLVNGRRNSGSGQVQVNGRGEVTRIQVSSSYEGQRISVSFRVDD